MKTLKNKFWKSLLLFLFFISTDCFSQTAVYAYRVTFKNKNGSASYADSLNFLSLKAMQRRNKQGVYLDYYDLPIVQKYIDSVVAISNAFRVKNRSKWFNQIVILKKDSITANISNLNFVDAVKLVGYFPSGWGARYAKPATPDKSTVIYQESKMERGVTDSLYGKSFFQIHLTNTDFLHSLGFKADDKHIALIDMGFRNIKVLHAFDSLRLQNRLMDKWNYVRDTTNVDSFSVTLTHGSDCLSLMATNLPGTYIGSAPNAKYSTYISEDYAFENPLEFDNWVSAAERADSVGVDLITTSLGYNIFDAAFTNDNLTYANDLNGYSTLITKGVNMAVSRGIFCTSAMGNSGASSWHFLIAPADADSAYSVGEIDTSLKFTSSKGSSYGPNAVGQVKPDGITIGLKVCLIANTAGIPAYSNGTSFATPLLAGGIACLMQALPKLNIFQIRRLIQQSSSNFYTPSDSIGYGIPNFKIAFETGQALAINNIILGNEKSYTLYPNPSTDYINVENENHSFNNANFEILNINGKTISSTTQSGNTIKLSTQNLESGVYFLRIKNNTEMVVKSFLVK